MQEAKYVEGEVGSNKTKTNMVCTNSRSFQRPKSTTQSRSSLPLQPNQDTVPTDTSIHKPQFCIKTKLQELHIEECAKNPNLLQTGLKYNSYLLEKIVVKERLNTLILNLHSGNRSYSLMCPTMPNSKTSKDNTAKELISWPYEIGKLLSYIDNEELPAYFVDLLESSRSFLFYDGCIIIEVQRNRDAYPLPICDIYYVLLKPTYTSILADVDKISTENSEWDMKEMLQCESEILKANYPNLCLDNNNEISALASKCNHNSKLFSTLKFRQSARRRSLHMANFKKKFLSQKRFSKTNESAAAATKAACREYSSREEMTPLTLSVKQISNLSSHFKCIPVQESNDFYPQLVEKYVLETDSSCKSRVYHIKLSILQRPYNGEYLGELYLDRDYKENQKNGAACRFLLGTRVHAARYIQQFIDIFREGGRKPVRISYSSAGSKNQQQSQNTSRTVNGTYLQQNAMVANAQRTQKREATAILNNIRDSGQLDKKHEQQNIISTSNNAAIINYVNTDGNAATTNQVYSYKINQTNNRLSDTSVQLGHNSGQAVTLTSVSSGYTNYPTFLATPAANQDTNAIFIEKIGTGTNVAQSQAATTLHPQNSIINVQSINFAQVPGTNVQFHVSPSNSTQGHPTRVLISRQVTTGAASSTSVGQSSTNTNFVSVATNKSMQAQIVTPRNSGPHGVNIPAQTTQSRQQTRSIKTATLNFHRK